MPSNIRNFFWLNVLSLVLGLGTAILAVMLLILWLIAFKRQNWARWLWIALFVLGTPGYIAIFKDLLGISLAGAISLTQVALQLVALYFVFTGNAKPWFRRTEAEAS